AAWAAPRGGGGASGEGPEHTDSSADARHKPDGRWGSAMNPHDGSRLAGHRHAFLRHLPRRVELIGRRLHRFLQDGWDINGLALIHDDARWLGAACEKHGP